MSLLNSCTVPISTLPSSWEQETRDLYISFRESNNPISITVASAMDVIVKLAKAGGGAIPSTDPTEFTSEFSSEFL